MSFDEALEVAPPKSLRSTSATRRPSRAASLAIPAPTIPLPTTSRSNGARASSARAASLQAARCHSGFVQALPPRASATSTRAYGALSGRSSRAAVMSPSGVVARISPP